MKIGTETKTVIQSIALTKEETDILVSAQKILDKLWDKIEDIEFDNMSATATSIHNSVDIIGCELDNIANLVDIED